MSHFEWMRCPRCNKTENMSYIGSLFFELIGLSIIGEIVIWVIAGIVLIILSMLNFNPVYWITILALCIIAVFFAEKLPWFSCKCCKKWYSSEELKREYNESLRYRTQGRQRTP